MKKIFLTLTLGLALLLSLVTISSCTKEPVIAAPTIVGNWKAEKVKIVEYFGGVKFSDTTVNDVTAWIGISFFFNFKEDKTFEDKTVEKSTGSVTTSTGNYSLNGSTLTLNYKDLTTQDFESVSVDAKRLVMISYDPNKSDPDRTVMTWEWSRQ
jgi:hypothetical protein